MNKDTAKLIFMGVLCVISALLTYYFHCILGVSAVFTHFFYIPIILGALWWRRKGLVVVAILSFILLSSQFFYSPHLQLFEGQYNNYMRTVMLLIVSGVVVYLREQMDKSSEKLEAYRVHLEDLVRIRTDELAKTNEALQTKIKEVEQAEKTIADSEKQLRRIIESSPVGICIVQDNCYVYFNAKLVSIFGYSNAEEIIGNSVESLFSSTQADLIRSRSKDRLAGKPVPSTYELQGVKKSGETFEVAVWLSVIDYQGRPSILGSVIDISLEKKMQKQIFQGQKMEAIGILAGGIAHKFNNILSVITGNVDMIKMHNSEDEKISKRLNGISNSVEKMVGLNKMLLAFARKGNYMVQKIHLNTLMKETLHIIPHPNASVYDVEMDLSEDLPPIQADYTQMQMILLAVIQNAIEAVNESGLICLCAFPTTISPEKAAQNPGMTPGKYVCIQIQDNGIGMDEETRSRIFEPFFTTHFYGRGLGMAAVYGIVKNHKGWIGVESQVDMGTTVSIYLPIIQEPADGEGEV